MNPVSAILTYDSSHNMAHFGGIVDSWAKFQPASHELNFRYNRTIIRGVTKKDLRPKT